jgi:hypothetical protein
LTFPAPKIFTARICARPDDCAEVEAAGVRGNESFWEHYELRTFLRGFVRQSGKLVDSTLAIENNGRSLHDSYF